MITVQPIESTENTIELESSVEKQFGNQIRRDYDNFGTFRCPRRCGQGD